MSMITEQIKTLRLYAEMLGDASIVKGDNTNLFGKKLVSNAADTIEELSTKLHASNMERPSQYYHGGWIPCEERLPQLDGQWQCGSYIVTVIIDGKSLVTSMTYDYCNKKWLCQKGNVVAWMQLETYREEK